MSDTNVVNTPPPEDFETVKPGSEPRHRTPDTGDPKAAQDKCREIVTQIITYLKKKVEEMPTVPGDAGSTGAKSDIENHLRHIEMVTLRSI